MENESSDLLIFYSSVDKYESYAQLMHRNSTIMACAKGALGPAEVLRVRVRINRRLIEMRNFAGLYHGIVDKSCEPNIPTPRNKMDKVMDWKRVDLVCGWRPN